MSSGGVKRRATFRGTSQVSACVHTGTQMMLLKSTAYTSRQAKKEELINSHICAVADHVLRRLEFPYN